MGLATTNPRLWAKNINWQSVVVCMCTKRVENFGHSDSSLKTNRLHTKQRNKIMKKIIIAVLVGFTALSALGGITLDDVKQVEHDQDALLALLPLCDNVKQERWVLRHVASLASLEPIGNRKAKGIELGITDPLMLKRLEAVDIQPGAERNAAVFALYAVHGLKAPSWRKLYDPRYSTTEETIEFYKLILKNCPLRNDSKRHLELIKAELKKLTD